MICINDLTKIFASTEVFLYYCSVVGVIVFCFGERFRRMSLIPLFAIPVNILINTYVPFDRILIVNLLFLTAYTVICILCYRSIKIKKIIMLMLFFFFSNLALFSITLLFFGLSGRDFSVIELVIAVLYLALVVIVGLTPAARNLGRLSDLVPTSVKVLMITLLFVNAMLLSIFSVASENGMDERFYNYIRFIILVAALMLIITAFFIFRIMVSHSKMQDTLDLYRKQIEAQSEYYKRLSEADREVRRFRHDIKNLSYGLIQLIKEKKNEEAVALIQKELSIMDVRKPPFETGNGIVDALLADKLGNCKGSGIEISFEGSIYPSGLDPKILCVVFGNTVDNAIEACKGLPEGKRRYVDIVCRSAGGYMFVKISNPVSSRVKIKGKFPETTKSDGSRHGIGLISLAEEIRANGGSFEFDCNDERFTVSVELVVRTAG